MLNYLYTCLKLITKKTRTSITKCLWIWCVVRLVFTVRHHVCRRVKFRSTIQVPCIGRWSFKTVVMSVVEMLAKGHVIMIHVIERMHWFCNVVITTCNDEKSTISIRNVVGTRLARILALTRDRLNYETTTTWTYIAIHIYLWKQPS